ncbi:Uncharacterised protein [Vibrio cholerae]|nr:Uncharacterised protein [Vibrio cholerae]
MVSEPSINHCPNSRCCWLRATRSLGKISAARISPLAIAFSASLTVR